MFVRQLGRLFPRLWHESGESQSEPATHYRQWRDLHQEQLTTVLRRQDELDDDTPQSRRETSCVEQRQAGSMQYVTR